MNIKTRLMALGFTGAILTGGVLVAIGEDEVLRTYVDPAGIEQPALAKPAITLNLAWCSLTSSA
jgi:lysozyme